MDAPNASVPSDGETVGAKYNFIAKFIPGKTEIKPLSNNTGAKWYTSVEGSGESGYASKQLSIDLNELKDSQKGQVGLLYENIGSYKGQIIDLKLSLTDWAVGTNPSGFTGSNRYVNFGADMISISTNDSVINTKWTFINESTGKPISLDGFFTFNDVDGGQGIGFSPSFSKQIDHIYVPDSNNHLNYINTNSAIGVYGSLYQLTEPDDLTSMFTVLYSGTSSMDMMWAGGVANPTQTPPITKYLGKMASNDSLEIDKVDKTVGDVGKQTGDYFGYIAKKPLATETIPPVKFVSDDDQKLVKDNTLKIQSDPFSYDVQAQVPDEWSQFYYKSYVITDDLIPELKLNSIRVTDETGKDSTGMFTNSTKDNHIELSATAVSLKSANFYNHTYTVHADVQLRSGQSFHNYVDEKTGVTTFENTATLIIDGKKASSNTVQTHVNKIGSSIDKWIVE